MDMKREKQLKSATPTTKQCRVQRIHEIVKLCPEPTSRVKNAEKNNEPEWKRQKRGIQKPTEVTQSQNAGHGPTPKLRYEARERDKGMRCKQGIQKRDAVQPIQHQI